MTALENWCKNACAIPATAGNQKLQHLDLIRDDLIAVIGDHTAGATRKDINKELGEKNPSVRKAAAAEVLNTSREAEEQQNICSGNMQPISRTFRD